MTTINNGIASLAGVRWPVDAHVHFHDVALAGPTLDAAAANFQAVNGRAGEFLGALLLAQAAGERVFEALGDFQASGGWTIAPAADEPESLIAGKDDARILIVCGRQVRADDGAEVLALGTREFIPDGLSFAEALDAVRRSAALPVIPWGLGKLLGARGKRVKKLLAAQRADTLFVGDNGSRLELLGIPSLIRTWEQLGFRVLPGTDPFPIGRDHRRVGGFGFLADMNPSEAAPWRSLRAWLVERSASPPPYGRACGPGRFLVIQAGIQVYNRFRRRQTA